MNREILLLACLLISPHCAAAQTNIDCGRNGEVAAEAEQAAEAAEHAYQLAKAAETADLSEARENDGAHLTCSVAAQAFARSFENKKLGISAEQTFKEFEPKLAGDAYARNTAILFIKSAYERPDLQVSQAEVLRLEQVCRDFR